MSEQEETDLKLVRGLHGLYVGMLTPEEKEAFERLIPLGHTGRDYRHVGGFLGLAKVRVIEVEAQHE
jgi:hypothetical protein